MTYDPVIIYPKWQTHRQPTIPTKGEHMCNSQRSPISIAILSILLALSMACSRRPSDDQIAKDIQDKAALDPDTKESPVKVEAKEGKVTLTGKVRTPAAQKKLEQIAREEPGNASVDDQTTVDPDAIASQQVAPAMAAALPPVQKPKPQPIVVPAGTTLTIGRVYLESRGLAANTINQQLAAVRRLAHEAADAGLLSPELAAGISRVKGVKQLGFRAGNWLSGAQSSEVLLRADGEGMRAKRDYAMLAMLFGCGFRRSELVGLELGEIQIRQGHWAVVDLIGKGGHVRTVPIPEWVKAALDQWTRAAC
jgi:integrase